MIIIIRFLLLLVHLWAIYYIALTFKNEDAPDPLRWNLCCVIAIVSIVLLGLSFILK